MIVRWTQQAARELADHYNYHRSHNTAAARRLRRAVMDGASRLRNFPRMGKPGRVEGTRELVIDRTPFVLVYRENADRVEIVHCHHGRQNWQGGAAENIEP